MRNWFEWGRLEAGGCVLVGSVTEYDDRPGPLRDLVLRNEQRWRDALQRAAQLAIDFGHLRDGDTDQYPFELYENPLAMLHDSGPFGYPPHRPHRSGRIGRGRHRHPPSTPTRSPTQV